MFKIKKARTVCSTNQTINGIEYQPVTTRFLFRDKEIEIYNLEALSEKPFIGCYLTKEKAQELVDWLNSCLNEKRCDQCYNQRLSKNMALSGKIVCKNCGETICEEPIK